MKNAFANPKAFAAFFDERVLVEGARSGRTVHQVCRACVLDAGLVDADADAVADSTEHAYSVRILRADWNEVEPPRRGDTIKLESGVEMRATSVERDENWFELHAKTKGGAA